MSGKLGSATSAWTSRQKQWFNYVCKVQLYFCYSINLVSGMKLLCGEDNQLTNRVLLTPKKCKTTIFLYHHPTAGFTFKALELFPKNKKMIILKIILQYILNIKSNNQFISSRLEIFIIKEIFISSTLNAHTNINIIPLWWCLEVISCGCRDNFSWEILELKMITVDTKIKHSKLMIQKLKLLNV